MTEKDKVIEEKVKYNGIFNFKDVYQFIFRWLIENGYEVTEDKYQEEIQGEEKKIDIGWNAKLTISDYFQYEIKLSYRILNLKKIEADKDGKRVKTNSGTFELKIAGFLAKDYENTWEKNPMMKFFRGVYDRYIVEGIINKYKKKIREDVDELLEDIKGYLATAGAKQLG